MKKLLLCKYCGAKFKASPGQKWHTCPAAKEARRQLNVQYQKEYNQRVGKPRHRATSSPNRHRARQGGDRVCRGCGKPTFNYYYCPACWDKIANRENVPSDALGHELGTAWL